MFFKGLNIEYKELNNKMPLIEAIKQKGAKGHNPEEIDEDSFDKFLDKLEELGWKQKKDNKKKYKKMFHRDTYEKLIAYTGL